jgi:LCP family protein required for cell wall assembly
MYVENNKNPKKKKRKVIIIAVAAILLVVISAYGYTTYFFHAIVTEESHSVTKPEEPEAKVNVLFIGVADGLSDTIMLCNYDPKTDEIKIVSIPRDTYFPRAGYVHPAQKKINSVYGSQGADGLVNSVEGLTGVNINYYWKFDYKTVEAVVDAIGGVPYTIPRNMDYDDPADDLHIHFAQGAVIEKGSDIVKALRWRKNNNGSGYAEGDLGRIKNQHEIIKLGIDKLLSGNMAVNIIKVQQPVMKDVKTNMPADQILYYLTKLRDVHSEKMSFSMIPGNAEYEEGVSFFIPDKDKMTEELKSMGYDSNS